MMPHHKGRIMSPLIKTASLSLLRQNIRPEISWRRSLSMVRRREHPHLRAHGTGEIACNYGAFAVRALHSTACYRHDRPLDHMSVPLSDEAIEMARKYWAHQKVYDLWDPESTDPHHTQKANDALQSMARYRRAYTKLVLERDTLPPGTRTYEPPDITQLNYSEEEEDETTSIYGRPHSRSDSEPILSPEQERVVELAVAGHNIFYTGSAGCGKSTVLGAIRNRLLQMNKTVHVMAPTGRVAISNAGTTTWSFAGWTPNSHKKSQAKLRKLDKEIRQKFMGTHTIIIDEISMVDNLHFQRLSEVMKAVRPRNSPLAQLPFGGVQVIVTGDFCQLPPVKPFRHCIRCGSDLIPDALRRTYLCPKKTCRRVYQDDDKWAFRSQAWTDCNFQYVHLETIHRQSDTRFINLLEKCRFGEPLDSSDIRLLTNHDSPNVNNAVKLYCTREEVRKTNEREFQRLQTLPQKYQCVDLFSWNDKLHPSLQPYHQKNVDGSLRALNDHSFECELQLKKGMLVVLLTNIDLARGLCNGAQGIITGFEPYGSRQLPGDRAMKDDRDLPFYWPDPTMSLWQSQMRKYSEKNHTCGGGWPIVKFHNGIKCTVYPSCQTVLLGNHKPYSVLARTQIPLAAAWAISVHKSQGMTLERAIVNLTRAFEEGQVYVALSRAKSLEGLKIEGDATKLGQFRGNEQVIAFLKEKFGERISAGAQRGLTESVAVGNTAS